MSQTLVTDDLIYYPTLRASLDERYGGPGITNPRKFNGQEIFRTILKFLSTQKKSTCEDISILEHKKNISSKRELRSITDNIRKFIRINLLPLHLVKTDGTKKSTKQQVQCYSLTYFGILYTIHLFSNGKDYEYDLKTIRNVAKEYRNYLPKVFGRFEEFKKILGEDFEYALGLRDFSEELSSVGSFYHPSEILNEAISYLDNARNRRYPNIDSLLENQISLVVYNNLFDRLEVYETKMYFLKSKTTPNDKLEEKLERKGRIKLKKILNSDSQIKKWYHDYVKFVINQNKEKNKTLSKIQTLLE